MPFNYTYDESKLSVTEKSIAEVNKDANYVFYSKKNPVFYLGNALYYSLANAGGYTIEESLNVSSSSTKVYRTPEQFYEEFSTYYSGSEWQNKVLSKINQ